MNKNIFAQTKQTFDTFKMNPENKNTAQKQKNGFDIIRTFAATLPQKSGVYRMIDNKNNALYVGKARQLRNRVLSYTRPNGLSNRILTMINKTHHMECSITKTEAEALLLEANLIKKLKPIFNIILRDDKSLPHILIETEHEAPKIIKHRGAHKKKGHYFGPFASARAVNQTVNTLQRGFLIRNCPDSVYQNRTRPCLLYQIKRCAAPCTGKINLQDYQELVQQAADFLSGNTAQLEKKLMQKMQNAAHNLDFEHAANIRDRLSALTKIHAKQSIHTKTVQNADLFVIENQNALFCVHVSFFRNNAHQGDKAYFPKADKDHTQDEVLSAFITQFYDKKPCPKTIIINQKIPNKTLIEQAFSEKHGKKISLLIPARGEKKDLIDNARTNAKFALEQKLSERTSQKHTLKQLAQIFNLKKIPERIEIYDNSHIAGTLPIGVMIVAGQDGWQKNHYRKFNIKNPNTMPGDDVAMMEEVITRRFNPNAKNPQIIPDLIIIDGGKGQRNAARKILKKYTLNIPVIAIAKGKKRNAGEEYFHSNAEKPQKIKPPHPVLFYMQRLRDEAHRFAIGGHRLRRTKKNKQNPLDELPGIGAKRKKELLKRFGSAKEVSRANPKDIEKTHGISKNMAQNIYDYFQNNP